MAVDFVGGNTIKPGGNGDTPETKTADVVEGIKESLGSQVLGQGYASGSIEDVIKYLLKMGIIQLSEGLGILLAGLDQCPLVHFNHY